MVGLGWGEDSPLHWSPPVTNMMQKALPDAKAFHLPELILKGLEAISGLQGKARMRHKKNKRALEELVGSPVFGSILVGAFLSKIRAFYQS